MESFLSLGRMHWDHEPQQIEDGDENENENENENDSTKFETKFETKFRRRYPPWRGRGEGSCTHLGPAPR
jgi:hypothetical protein